MPRRTRKPQIRRSQNVAVMIGIVTSIAALYFAQDVLIPLTLAVMFSFLLATPADWLERHRIGRVPSVLIVVAVATALLCALTFVVGRQVYALADSLPNYKDKIEAKARIIRGGNDGGDRNVIDKIKDVGQAISNVDDTGNDGSTPAERDGERNPLAPKTTVTNNAVAVGASVAAPPTTQPGTTAANPLYVTPVESALTPMQMLSQFGTVVLSPLGTAGLVWVFVVFVLLEREALRDRLIRLVSGGKYTVTTKAINDAATRIKRYLVAQSIVNGTYGVAISFGLWLIGLTLGHGQSFPSFVLWGLLCAMLRFIPYVGPWVAAAFPIALSLVVYDGFAVFIAVVSMFVVIELLSNNLMEPWLYGSSTGMSTIAVLVAAVFWTWLWGPIGLLLATPLTVCIVVIGKYVGQLSFFDVMLSDQAALPPSVSYYQRLLAGDRREATDLARETMNEKGREYVPDDVFVPAVLLTRRDREDDDLTADTEAKIYQETAAIIDETLRSTEDKKLGRAHAEENAGAGEPDATTPSAAPAAPARVFGCPAHHRSEELVLQMLGRLLGTSAGRMEIASTRLLPSEVKERICTDKPEVVFVAIVPPGGIVQARFFVRRLRKQIPDTPIIVGYFGKIRDFDRLLNRMRSAGATQVVTTVLQSYRVLQNMLGITETNAASGATVPGGRRDVSESPRTGGIAPATPPPATAGDRPVLQPAPPSTKDDLTSLPNHP